MQDEFNVIDFDGDEAVAEAMAGLDEQSSTRSGLLKAGAGALAGLGGVSLLRPGAASARGGGSKANDVKILNYALTLEYLEAAFYAEALRVGGYSGAVGRFASTVAAHEATHVATLKGVLGAKAVKSPSFDFKGTTRKWSTFLRTAKVLEDTGVAACSATPRSSAPRSGSVPRCRAAAHSRRPRSSSMTPACRPTRARRRSSSHRTCSWPRS